MAEKLFHRREETLSRRENQVISASKEYVSAATLKYQHLCGECAFMYSSSFLMLDEEAKTALLGYNTRLYYLLRNPCA